MTECDGLGANNDAAYKYAASGLRVQKAVGKVTARVWAALPTALGAATLQV